MLFLVGMGLEEGDMSLKGLKAVSDSKEVYIEDYTSFPYRPGFDARRLSREEVESDFLIKRAKLGKVTLLVPGDPLFATTHISLVAECRKEGVPVEVIHAPSVINAISRTGLSPYKFGRTVTLSGPVESDRERIESNVAAGLHTLCLLDPKIDAARGLDVLRGMGFSGRMVVCERIGTRDERISYGEVPDLQAQGFGAPPHCIILPAELHFFEEEFLQQFSIKA